MQMRRRQILLTSKFEEVAKAQEEMEVDAPSAAPALVQHLEPLEAFIPEEEKAEWAAKKEDICQSGKALPPRAAQAQPTPVPVRPLPKAAAVPVAKQPSVPVPLLRGHQNRYGRQAGPGHGGGRQRSVMARKQLTLIVAFAPHEV
ncbi:unnamed protein product [Prorocentrum cordatum]|uniref:Uncharacterized protein n=1 Tax=Prorocentrum cordatum TaxID=2364126 RepID=A0ABN9QIB0_9DINO|nr:unnamed protein product [Polarella glacialis]